jgi:hypothetical protein
MSGAILSAHSAEPLTQQLHVELNEIMRTTRWGLVKVIRDGSLTDFIVQEYALAGVVFETIQITNSLLQREEVNVILDLGMANVLAFQQHPELRNIVRTACQTGKFGAIASQGESLSKCHHNAYLLTGTQRYLGRLNPPPLQQPLQKVRTSYLVVSIVSSHLIGF